MNLSNKKFIFFDMDGLLLDTETLYYETRKEILAKYGFKFEKKDHESYIARGFPVTIQKLQNIVGDKKLGEKVFNEAMELYNQKLADGQIKLKKGALKLLNFLQINGKKCFITSSAAKKTIIQTAQVTGIDEYFVGFISGDEVQRNKPAPDIYLHALQMTGANKDESLVFEDATTGIVAGVNAGLDVIVVPDWIQPDKETLKMSLKVINNLSEAIPLLKN